MRLGLCVDPHKTAALGLSQRVKESFGIGVSGLSPKEQKIRNALWDKIRGEMKPYNPDVDAHLIPGLGLHPGFSPESQSQIQIPAEQLRTVGKKIVRGCEYWLSNGRIVDAPYELSIHIIRAEDIPHIIQLFEQFGPEFLGPGCRIRRAGPKDDPGIALYEIVIWDSWTLYAHILPPD